MDASFSADVDEVVEEEAQTAAAVEVEEDDVMGAPDVDVADADEKTKVVLAVVAVGESVNAVDDVGGAACWFPSLSDLWSGTEVFVGQFSSLSSCTKLTFLILAAICLTSMSCSDSSEFAPFWVQK